MENIKIALVCGLCAGCKHAVQLAKDASKLEIVTLFKEIVHNKNINNHLKESGINCIQNLEDLTSDSTVVLRAHGEPPETYDYLENHGIKFLDGTCKNVKAIHEEVKFHSKNNEVILIIGKYGKYSGKIHPEVLGTIGYCNNAPVLIEDLDDLDKLKSIKNSKIFAICQTTFNPKKFEIIKDSLIEICNQNNNEITIKNTICGAQLVIQKSSLALAKESDLMIVVGGKNSSNTIELFNNVSTITKAIHIENVEDWLNEVGAINFEINLDTKIGITAGASTDKNELLLLKEKIENYLKH